MPAYHLTVTINAHREGMIAVPSLRSVVQAKVLAEARGFRIEVIAILDRPDAETIEIFEKWSTKEEVKDDLRLFTVDYGDLGLSRNHAVANARGDWVAFLDADDLWGENWLAAVLESSANDQRNIVWHPEINVYFGIEPHLFRHIDMEDGEFDLTSLVISNYWTALCATKRDLLTRIPYKETSRQRCIGYEDWSWNQLTIEAGALHKVIRGTGHAIRQKPGSRSMLWIMNEAGSIPFLTNMMRTHIAKRAAEGLDRRTNSEG